MISSKGFAVTTAYSTPLPADGSRRYAEIQNNTSGVLFITVGGSTTDADAIQIQPGDFYVPLVPMGGEIKARSTVAGNIVVMGDNLI